MVTAHKKLIEGVIGNLPLFRQATGAHLAEVVRSARAEQVSRGKLLFRRGERLQGLYALAYGLVKLALRTPGGDERVLRLAGPGETFGDAIAFLDRPSPLEALALVDSMVVLVPIQALHALIDRDQRFARSMIANLSENLHGLVAELEATSLRSGLQRLAAYLDTLAGPGETRLCVHLPATKTIIAAHLGITKETFSRLLRDLMRQGLVAVSKRDVTLLDRARLSALSRGAGKPGDSPATPAPGARVRQNLVLDMRQRNDNAIG